MYPLRESHNKTLAPIALFVYNRPSHTRQTVASLANNLLAPDSDLFIFSDAPKNEGATQLVGEVREYIKSISGFKSVTIVERDRNFGLANSVIGGVTQLCEQFGQVIVLEDDLVTLPNFLLYMNEALTKYKDQAQVYSVTGYSFTSEVAGLDSTYFLPMTSTWGWGTWKNKWKIFERNKDRLLADLSESSFRSSFDLDDTCQYSEMAGNAVRGKVDSWGIYWYYCVFKAKGICLFPAKSLIQNIGYDGTGTHSRGTNEKPLVAYDPVLSDEIRVKAPIKMIVQTILYQLRNGPAKPNMFSRARKKFALRNIKSKLRQKVIRFFIAQADRVQDEYNKKRCVCGVGTVLYPSCTVDNETPYKSLISIGSNTHVRANLQVFPHGGNITIGDFCYLGDHTRVWSMSSVQIGNRVLISHGVNIHDHIAHSLSASDRHAHFKEIITTGHPYQLNNVTSMPVVIEDDAWIGFNATVLKGVTVGRGAIVGACAVVTKDVAPYSVVVGNPARVVGPARE